MAEEGRSLGLQSQTGLFSEFQASPLHGKIVSQHQTKKELYMWARCILASHAQGPGFDSQYSTITMTTKITTTTTTIVFNQLH